MTGGDGDVGYQLFQDGREALRNNDVEKAAKLLRRSFELDAHGANAHWLSEALVRQGLSQEAVQWSARAYGLALRTAVVATGYADRLIRTGNTPEAGNVLRALLATCPDYGPARRLLATLTASGSPARQRSALDP
jgi:hypothetical protein